jgi:alkylation response protein AidB-like acyl-CoA dehydrogenase
VDFTDTEQEANFRAELRRWLSEHAADAAIPEDPAARADAQNAWHQTLYEAGYIGLSFPVEDGGHGKPPIYEAILNDELGRAGAPPIEGVGHLSNALRLFGTARQRADLLPGLLSGRVRWCQGFSEPEAGSDLAGLKTRAEAIDLDGQHVFRVNGRKIWTSFGTVADWCFLLCRTDLDVAKHAGISVLLVPMSTPGIEVRPIVNAARNREFTEITFDDVDVPSENLLGERGQGWAIANQLLAYERGPSDINWISRLSMQLRRRCPYWPARRLACGAGPTRASLRRATRPSGQGATVPDRPATRETAGPGGIRGQAVDGTGRSSRRTRDDGSTG